MTQPMSPPDTRPAIGDVILAIDPGSERSGWVAYNPATRTVRRCGIDANTDLLEAIEAEALGVLPGDNQLGVPRYERLVIEWMTSYGRTIGAETFEALWWAGRFAQASAGRAERLTRRAVVQHLCGGARRAGDPTADAMVWQVLVDRFGGIGGKDVAVGRKAAPGPLYGVTSHARAALAVAVAFTDDPKLAFVP